MLRNVCILGEAEARSSTSVSHLSLELFSLLPALPGSGLAETVEIWLMCLFPHPLHQCSSVQPVFRKIMLNNNSVGWILGKMYSPHVNVVFVLSVSELLMGEVDSSTLLSLLPTEKSRVSFRTVQSSPARNVNVSLDAECQ